MRPATVRYYFDADILGLGKVVAGLRPDATYRGIRALLCASGSDPRAQLLAQMSTMSIGFLV